MGIGRMQSGLLILSEKRWFVGVRATTKKFYIYWSGEVSSVFGLTEIEEKIWIKLWE